MDISLETAICKTIKQLLQQRFGNTIFEDIYYDFESHEIILYDNLRNASKKAPELIETLKSIDKTIIDWIIEEYGYKKVLHDIQSEPKEDAIKTFILLFQTKSQKPLKILKLAFKNTTFNPNLKFTYWLGILSGLFIINKIYT